MVSVVGIASSRLEDPDGTLNVLFFVFIHYQWTRFKLTSGCGIEFIIKWVAQCQYREEISTDWVAGASNTVRLSAIGLLDEEYFMGTTKRWTFGLQANKAGWSCWYVLKMRCTFSWDKAQVTDTSNDHSNVYSPILVWFHDDIFSSKNYGWLQVSLMSVGFLVLHCGDCGEYQGKPGYRPTKLLDDFFIIVFPLKRFTVPYQGYGRVKFYRKLSEYLNLSH